MKKVILIIFISIILLVLFISIGLIGLKALPYILERMCTSNKRIRESSLDELKVILEIGDADSFKLINIIHVRGGLRKW